jgi:UDP-glucose 4-epimerase
MQSRKILITGGAGFIGSTLANYFDSLSNCTVVAVDNLSSGNWNQVSNGVQKLTLDLSRCSENELEDLLSGVDVLFHLSAVKLHNEKNSFEDILKHNVLSSERLFEAAGKAGVRNVVFTSSLYAYGMLNQDQMYETDLPKPVTNYGASKLFGENMLATASKKYGFSYSVARLFFMYGENQYSDGGYKSVIVRNFERLKANQPAIITGDGNQILDYLYVGDCVAALVEISKDPKNEIFNVSSGIPLTINELTKAMVEVAGGGSIEHVSPDWTSGTRRVGSNSLLKSLTGWEPRVSLIDGLRLTWSSLND